MRISAKKVFARLVLFSRALFILHIPKSFSIAL